MALKTTLDSLEGLPDPLKSEYELRDGKYHIRVEGEIPGFVPVTTLEETKKSLASFRDNNIGLTKKTSELEKAQAELAEKLKSFDGIDPAEHVALKARIKELEAKGVTRDTDVSTLVQRAVQSAVDPLQRRLDEVTAREKAAEERERKAAEALARKQTESDLISVGRKLGVEERAVPDYVRRGLEIFRYEEGKLVAKDGDAPIFSPSNPTLPLGVEEWAKGLLVDAPHLFKTSKGGGAAPKEGGGSTHAAKRVISNDPLEFGRNLEGIAKGDVIVQS